MSKHSEYEHAASWKDGLWLRLVAALVVARWQHLWPFRS